MKKRNLIFRPVEAIMYSLVMALIVQFHMPFLGSGLWVPIVIVLLMISPSAIWWYIGLNVIAGLVILVHAHIVMYFRRKNSDGL